MADRRERPGLSTTASVAEPSPARAGRDPKRWRLVIAWSADEPERVGESAELVVGKPLVLGREGTWQEGAAPVLFAPRRHHALTPGRPVQGKAISRRQLRLRVREDGVEVERVGRCALQVRGHTVERARLAPGRSLVLANQLVLLCLHEPRPPEVEAEHGFGEPDAHGIVGEGAAAWRLRERLRFFGGSDEHVLLLGDSGTGKELAAQTLHACSARSGHPLVARNAATLPPGLIDGELFGNIADYPNPGTPARDGLMGAADGSTLFLDEIGELPAELQAHLLRVLDADGEYQRLGEDRLRRSRFRLVAATNRPIASLKHDLAARLPLRLTLPGLDERRGDVPLLIRHLLSLAAESTPEVAARFFDDDGRPRLAAELVAALVEHRYTLHVRELKNLLWEAIAASTSDRIELAETMNTARGSEDHADGGPSAAQIRDALADNAGNVTRAAAALGISRHALNRLLRKHAIDPATLRR